jgi:hypothetical protein
MFPAILTQLEALQLALNGQTLIPVVMKHLLYIYGASICVPDVTSQ